MNVKKYHTVWENPDWKNSNRDIMKRLDYYIAIQNILDRSRIVRTRSKEVW